MKKASPIMIAGAIVVVAIALITWSYFAPGKYDVFAQCLGEKGAVFYGAFWCPHCQDQKKLFGNSRGLLPYVECSTPNGKDQLQICKDKKIEGYPTWEFIDGTRRAETLPLEELAKITGCPLAEE